MYLFDGRSEKVCYAAKMYAINVCLLLTHSMTHLSQQRMCALISLCP